MVPSEPSVRRIRSTALATTATVSLAVGMAVVGHRFMFTTVPPSPTKPMVIASISGFTATANERVLGRTIGLGLPTWAVATWVSSTRPPSVNSSTRSFTVDRDNPVMRVNSERLIARRRCARVRTADRLRRRTSSVLVPILTIPLP